VVVVIIIVVVVNVVVGGRKEDADGKVGKWSSHRAVHEQVKELVSFCSPNVAIYTAATQRLIGATTKIRQQIGGD